jgi:tRNA (cmo5U34)-methyltransferase
MTHGNAPYSDPTAIAAYAENARRNVPGLADFHRMVMVLLAEHVPDAARILVVGAGGGMETLAMAQAQPGWTFAGVDPSAAMIDQAKAVVRPVADRVALVVGTVDHLPEDVFDGATCLLTFHHLDRAERLRTLQEVRRRLKPEAPLVIMQHTAPNLDPTRWMTRFAAFRDRDGPDWEQARATAKVMSERLHLFTPTEEEEILRQAGFTDVELFYAAFSFRGWVARRA